VAGGSPCIPIPRDRTQDGDCAVVWLRQTVWIGGLMLADISLLEQAACPSVADTLWKVDSRGRGDADQIARQPHDGEDDRNRCEHPQYPCTHPHPVPRFGRDPHAPCQELQSAILIKRVPRSYYVRNSAASNPLDHLNLSTMAHSSCYPT